MQYRGKSTLILFCIVTSAVIGLAPPLFTKLLIDDAIPKGSLNRVFLLVAGIAASQLLTTLVANYQSALSAFVGESVARDLRTRLVAHLHAMPISFFSVTRSGEIVNRVSNDIGQIKDFASGTFVTVVADGTTLLVALAAVFVLDWRLALLSLLLIPLAIFPTLSVGQKMREARRRTLEAGDAIAANALDTLSVSGTTLVKIFCRERFEQTRFRINATELMNQRLKHAGVARQFAMLLVLISTAVPAAMWLGGGVLALKGVVSVGTIVAFVAYLGRLFAPTWALVSVRVRVVSAGVVFDRVFEYLQKPTEREHRGGGTTLVNPRGEIAFEGVQFSYGNRVVLSDLSFRVDPGLVAAFVGRSGAGKTTIAQLLLGFYAPLHGRITIDGHDISGIDLGSLRRAIGIVPQETYLFHDTIGANIRYGRLDADLDAVESAARTANIHELIATLPNGYETIVGERGHLLSAGERQRLAIARVLLKDPRILILDEATSSLDTVNEALIQSALERAMKGRTNLIIAHRLSTIVSADVIFVVDRGCIVESGSHVELMDRGGAYSVLFSEQFRSGVCAS